jgi:hypothetical protein
VCRLTNLETLAQVIDLGDIRTARGPENYAVLFFEIVAVLKSRLVNIHIVR